MKKLKDKYNQLFSGESGGVFRGMITLLIGAGLARIIGIVSIPVLTRLYSPEDYGVLALYTSFVAILAPVLTLRYVQAIPLPKTDMMAFNLFSLCFKLIFIGSLCLAIILLLLGETILGWFNMQALVPWWWLITLGAAGTALYELFSLWATRKKQYKTIATTQFAQSLIGNLAKVGLGLLAIKPAGLIIGQFLSQSAGITSFIKNARQDFKFFIPKVRAKKEKFIAKYYQDFVWFRFPSHILMVLSLQAPILMAAALYDKGVTGQLGLATMAISLPFSVIGVSISKAYYAEIASIGKTKPKKIKQITFDVQKKLFIIALPIAVILFFFSERLFALMFGEQWSEAGRYAAILSPYLLIRFTSSPLDQVLNVLGSQKMFLIINILRVAGFVMIFAFFKMSEIDSTWFVRIVSAYLATYYFFMSIFILLLIKRKAVTN